MEADIDRVDRHKVDPISLCSFLDVPLQEVLNFLDQDRLHMQQGFFPDVQHNYILGSDLNYDTDLCNVLMGVNLKQSDFLKIEQTYLADIVIQELEYQHFHDQTGDDKSKHPEATTDTEGWQYNKHMMHLQY